LVEIADLNLPTSIWRPHWGWPHWNCAETRSLAPEN